MDEIAATAFYAAPVPLMVVTGDQCAEPVVLLVSDRLKAMLGEGGQATVEGLPLGRVFRDVSSAALLSEIRQFGSASAVITTPAGERCEVGITASKAGRVGPGQLMVLGLEWPQARESRERDLRRSEKRLKDIVDNIDALLYLKSLDGRYVFVNASFEQLLGLSRAEVVGRTDLDLWPSAIASEYMANDDRVIRAGESMQFEETIAKASGSSGVWLSLKFPIYGEDGAIQGVGGFSTDFSDRNHAEAMIRAAKEEAERANLAKSEFLSRMSHELRTPLNSIIGFGQLLQLAELPRDAFDSAGQILRAGRHLLTLINEVLEISRIEAGPPATSMEPVHACDPLHEAIELVRPLAAAAQIDLSCDMHAILFTFVSADYQRLKQVLLNVLMNAIKYNAQHGSIVVTAETAGEKLRYRVMDSGRGMSESDIERIFLPFERLDAGSSNIEGTGLGLALSKSFMEAMNGSIGVERSVKGRGSVFFVEVELARNVDHASGLVRSIEAHAVSTVAALDPISIVYIEDNLTNVELVERILQMQESAVVIPAAQGRLGIELAALHQPDLILLDLHLPDIDGEEVLRRLKSLPKTRDIPVVIVSADATSGRPEYLRDLGAADYISKPLDVTSFIQRIHKAVDDHA